VELSEPSSSAADNEEPPAPRQAASSPRNKPAPPAPVSAAPKKKAAVAAKPRRASAKTSGTPNHHVRIELKDRGRINEIRALLTERGDTNHFTVHTDGFWRVYVGAYEEEYEAWNRAAQIQALTGEKPQVLLPGS
jgi:hypothetical protein